MTKFEKKLKKTLKNELLDTNPTTQLKTRIYQENDVNLPKPFTFKFKWSYACIFILIIMCTTLLTITLFDNKPSTSVNPNNQYLALVTIDVNPSIEMVIDEKNQVLSVYGNNDEGKMIIEGENIIGQNIEDVINSIISIELQTKYLVPGIENEIALSVTSDEDGKNKLLQENIKQIISTSCNNNSINANIKIDNSKTIEELRDLVLKYNPTIDEKVSDTYSLTNLLNEIKLYQLEVKNFATKKLEDLYLEVKNQSITLAEQESIKNAINNLDNELYQNLIDEYNEKYNLFVDAYNLVESKYEEYFILEDSLYQQMLVSLQEKKQELNIQKQLLGQKSLENDLIGYFEINTKVLNLTWELKNIEQSLIDLEESATSLYQGICNKIISTIKELDDIRNKIPTNILTYKFSEIFDTASELYEYKNNLLKDFEFKYQKDINKEKNSVSNLKTKMKEK